MDNPKYIPRKTTSTKDSVRRAIDGFLDGYVSGQLKNHKEAIEYHAENIISLSKEMRLDEKYVPKKAPTEFSDVSEWVKFGVYMNHIVTTEDISENKKLYLNFANHYFELSKNIGYSKIETPAKDLVKTLIQAAEEIKNKKRI